MQWKPASCIHSKKCWHELPAVFNPKKKPWIKLEGAIAKKIIGQVNSCPSGALSIVTESINTNNMEQPKTKISLKKNGPLLVHGTLEITGIDGEVVLKEKITAFCRCGSSGNKPFCDGSHSKIGFVG